MLQVLHELWDFVLKMKYIAYRGNILWAHQLLHRLMDFVHTHTQWPTWHEDDRNYRILRCCKFYMSYGTLSRGVASVSCRHISSYVRKCFTFLKYVSCNYTPYKDIQCESKCGHYIWMRALEELESFSRSYWCHLLHVTRSTSLINRENLCVVLIKMAH